MSPIEEQGTFGGDYRLANPKFGMGILWDCKPEGVRPASDVATTSDAGLSFGLSRNEVREGTHVYELIEDHIMKRVDNCSWQMV